MFAFEQLGNNLFFQRFEGLGVAEKTSDADQQVAKQRLHLRRCLLEITHVILDVIDFVYGHATLNSAIDGAGLVLRKIMPSVGSQQNENLLERTV